MKNVETITAIVVAIGAASLIYYYSRDKKKPKLVVEQKEILGTEVAKQEASKYSNGLLKEYDILIPHAHPSKSVREKAELVSKERHQVNPHKRAYPTFLHEF
jgi:hypothetical protein